MQRTAVAVGLLFAAFTLLCPVGCRRQPSAVEEVHARAKAREKQARAGFTEGRKRAEGLIGSAFRDADPGPAGPDEPPHIIRLAINTIPQEQLTRELPEDFVRVWFMQDDGETPALSRECRVSGEAAVGAPTGWFYAGAPWFILGNPRDGKLKIEVRGRGFEEITREVELPPRAEREKGDREADPDRPSGPDVVIDMGRLLHRYLLVVAFTDSVVADEERPVPITIGWRGPGLERTEETQLRLAAHGNVYSIEVEMPQGAQFASLRPAAPWLAREVPLEPRRLSQHADLVGPERFVVTGKVLRPDGGPAVGAQVVITGPREDRPRRVRSGPGGRYRIGRLPVGRLRIVASAEGYADSDAVELDYRAEGDTTAPDLKLAAKAD